MEKRRVTVFDFDGTLTSRDTFLEFIKYVRGTTAFYMGLIYYTPILVGYKLKLYPNWKAKQKIFSYFFKGMCYNEFVDWGIEFAKNIETFTRPDTIEKLKFHLKRKDMVYVITASVEEWVRPWCEMHGVSNVLGTKIEIDSMGKITGHFSSKNCYGMEKVERLLEVEPERRAYYLLSYGDSDGDKRLFEFSDDFYLLK